MSFSDLMQSGRGPGVIGMLLAMVVLAGFAILFLFAFDERFQGADISITAMISQQQKEIDDMSSRIERGGKTLTRAPELRRAADELRRGRVENQHLGMEVGKLVQRVDSLKSLLSSMTNEFNSYKDQYREMVRGKAKGSSIGRLTTRSGTIYENVTIREITAVGAQIRHDSGFKRIPYEELPAEMQDHFQFDPAQKAAALASESSARDEHDAAVNAVSESEKLLLAEKRRKSAENAKDNLVRAIAARESRIEFLGEELEALQEAMLLESRKAISRAPQIRGQIAAKQREIVALRSEVSRMKAGL